MARRQDAAARRRTPVYVEDRAVSQATKQGAKGVRLPSQEEKNYDGNGNRVKKTKGSNTTYYYGDAYENRAGVGIMHLFANHQRLASIRTDGNNQYYHGNHLGSASIITDSSGNLKQKIEYMPYGTYRAKSDLNGTYDYDTSFPDVNYTFTDQEYDDETGLYNYKARLYDPQLGRFISADSIVPNPGDLQALNRYSYCLNNPLIYKDPSGHSVVELHGPSWGDIWGYVGPYVDQALTVTGQALTAGKDAVVNAVVNAFTSYGDLLKAEMDAEKALGQNPVVQTIVSTAVSQFTETITKSPTAGTGVGAVWDGAVAYNQSGGNVNKTGDVVVQSLGCSIIGGVVGGLASGGWVTILGIAAGGACGATTGSVFSGFTEFYRNGDNLLGPLGPTTYPVNVEYLTFLALSQTEWVR